MNSVYVLLAFLGFTALGYLSLVRILYKHELGDRPFTFSELRTSLRSENILTLVARSIFLYTLPTVSFLLFWGWGPALLWLITSHFLIDTPSNFIASKMTREVDVAGHFTDFDSARGILRSALMQLMLIFLTTQIVVLLANLIDQQTGLLFALFGVLISIHLLRSAGGAVDAVVKLLASVGLLILGLILAQTMGIAVFGTWSPLPENIPWLRFDNRSILALLLLIGATHLGRTGSLQQGLMNLVGGVIVGLIVLCVAHLVLQQPVLDAPILSAEHRDANLPIFATVFLFVSVAMLTLLLRITNFGNLSNSNNEQPVHHEIIAQQTLSFLGLSLAVVLMLWIATASGIGAWNTHYIAWPETVTLQSHFSLAVRSLTAATGASLGTGAGGTSLLMAGICLFAAAALIYVNTALSEQTTLAEQMHEEEKTLFTYILSRKNTHGLVIFMLSMWFLNHGMGVHLWLVTMAVCWLLCCDTLLDYASELEEGVLQEHFRRLFSLGLFTLGVMQLFFVAISALLQDQIVLSSAAAGILVLAAYMCLKNALACVRGLQIKSESKLF